jgi:hypothetical protein
MYVIFSDAPEADFGVDPEHDAQVAAVKVTTVAARIPFFVKRNNFGSYRLRDDSPGACRRSVYGRGRHRCWRSDHHVRFESS